MSVVPASSDVWMRLTCHGAATPQEPPHHCAVVRHGGDDQTSPSYMAVLRLATELTDMVCISGLRDERRTGDTAAPSSGGAVSRSDDRRVQRTGEQQKARGLVQVHTSRRPGVAGPADRAQSAIGPVKPMHAGTVV